MAEPYACLGLTLTKSHLRLRRKRGYWCTKMFVCQSAFHLIMSRNISMQIRGSVQVCQSADIPVHVRNEDPVRDSRQIFRKFLRNGYSVAVLEGVCFLDDASVATNARTRAKSYILPKTHKYGIYLYTVLECNSLYAH